MRRTAVLRRVNATKIKTASGERVQKFSALRPALQRALEVVGSGRTFMLDVIVN
jgi:hypothetical protein